MGEGDLSRILRVRLSKIFLPLPATRRLYKSFVKWPRYNNKKGEGSCFIRHREIPRASSYVAFKAHSTESSRNRVQFTLAVISQPRNEARAGPVLYPLLRATEWHETGIIFPYAAARGFRASRYKRLTCSNVHDLLLHFPRGGGERCPLGLPFLMHSLPNQRDGSGTSVALRSVSGVLSFPNENRKSIIVKLDSN